MNHITVVAHGAPGSFVRRVQENPSIAVDLLDALMHVHAYDSASLGAIGEALVRRAIQQATEGKPYYGPESGAPTGDKG
jgi:hypothetical protein